MLDVLPKVREEIDAFPYGGEQSMVELDDFEESVYILYDSAGLSEAQLMVGESSIFFIARMDGEHSLLDLREEYERELGLEVSTEDIEGIVQELDAARFLDNSNFADLYRNLEHEFINNPVRQSACAGSVYSDDPEVLQDELDILIKNAPKPEEEGRVGNVMRRAPQGVIAPHMDFIRAAKCYGQVYRELSEHYNQPEVVIVLGTAHGRMNRRFAICDKGFATTSGMVPCHGEVVRRVLAETADIADFKEDIFFHRSEHSIELQAVWLEHIWAGVEILPILVGEMDEFIREPQKVKDDMEIAGMLAALEGIRQDYKVTLLASADLSHIGRRFGDERDLDKGFITETELADRDYLRHVLKGDGIGALQSLADHGDRYHICGTGCIFMLNALLPQLSGQLLGYYQAVSEELEQAVGCAGVIFE